MDTEQAAIVDVPMETERAAAIVDVPMETERAAIVDVPMDTEQAANEDAAHDVDQVLDPESTIQNLILSTVEIKNEYDEAKSIKILISGKVGSGKSTLTNAILGATIPKAPAHSNISEPGTTEVTEYTHTVEGVEVIVWDSPGLQDGTPSQPLYLQQIEKKCKHRDLTILCIQSGGAMRFMKGNPDICAMKKFTESFGKQFWDNTLIILTFANTIPVFHPDWKSLPPNKVGDLFRKQIDEWKVQIRKLLREEVGLDEEVVDRIQIVPAGHYKDVHLPGFQFWLTSVWLACMAIVSAPAGASLIKLNAPRLSPHKTVDPDTPISKPHQHPLNMQAIWSRFSVPVGATVLVSTVVQKVASKFHTTASSKTLALANTLADTAILTISEKAAAMSVVAAEKASLVYGCVPAVSVTAGIVAVSGTSVAVAAGYVAYCLYKKYHKRNDEN